MILFLSVAFLVVFTDQVIKLVLNQFKPDMLVQNQGIIFGSQNLNHNLLYLIFGLILFFSFIIMKKSLKDKKFLILGLVLVLGGAASNLLDRFFKGAVIDYFKLGNLFFNLADIAILTGLMIYLQQTLCQKHLK